jgi:protein SCO1/2
VKETTLRRRADSRPSLTSSYQTLDPTFDEPRFHRSAVSKSAMLGTALSSIASSLVASKRAVAGRVLGVVLLVAAASACTSGSAPPPASVGTVEDRPLPDSVAAIPLVDQNGTTVTLRQMADQVVVLVDFLTSCQEVCPITTGALIEIEQAVQAAVPDSGIRFVEVTVDPERDTPARLLAYRQLVGVDFTLLTGAPTDIAALWKELGIFYQQTPEDSPPGTDWQTGRPYTYDITHTDGLFLVDGNGHLRFYMGGIPRLAGDLAPPLRSLLNEEGEQNLSDPGSDAWTVADALQALSWLLGQTIPST